MGSMTKEQKKECGLPTNKEEEQKMQENCKDSISPPDTPAGRAWQTLCSSEMNLMEEISKLPNYMKKRCNCKKETIDVKLNVMGYTKHRVCISCGGYA